MRRKLSGYFLLSFLSFCFFTVAFLAIANVKVSASQSPQILPVNVPSIQYVPTPTIYKEEPTVSSPTIEEAKIPSPTPTVYITQSSVLAAATQAPTPTPKQTKAKPTETTPVPPTATPSPTDTLTPTLLPTQAQQSSSSNLETLFSQYSSSYNVSEDELKKIAECESGFNTTSDTGTYAGMFQFSAETWASVRGVMGLDPNPDLRKNPEEAIKTTAYMLSKGEQNAWPNCH